MRNFLLTTSAIVALSFMPVHAATVQEDSTLVVGMGVDAGTLDPRLMRDTTASRTADLLYSGLRQAFAMLVDQQTIVNDIYQGADAAATSIILPSSWAYSDSITQPPFDIERAMPTFNELGWSDTKGDRVLDKDGKPLEVTLAAHSEDPNRVQTVEFLQAMFEAAGVKATARITDWPSFSTNYVQQGKHQIALLGWLNIVDPDRLMFAQLSAGGPTNWGGYSNPEVDALLQEGRSTLEQAGRTEAYRKATAIVPEELPYYVVSAQGTSCSTPRICPLKFRQPHGETRAG